MLNINSSMTKGFLNGNNHLSGCYFAHSFGHGGYLLYLLNMNLCVVGGCLLYLLNLNLCVVGCLRMFQKCTMLSKYINHHFFFFLPTG